MAVMEQNTDRDNGTDFLLSGKAVDLLQCILSGLDDFILRIAKGIAEERFREAGTSGSLRVEAADVEQASRQVFEQILSQKDLPESVKEDLESMQQCLTEKCKAMR